MQKQTKIRIAQFAVLIAAAPVILWAHSRGPYPGFTTAPGDQPGVACTFCHYYQSQLNGGGGNVAVSFPQGLVYSPGQSQVFTITISDSTASLYGFQMTARLDSNPSTAQAGSFTAGAGQGIMCADYNFSQTGTCAASADNGIQWIEHANQPFTTNTIQVQWTAPATNLGNVHVYVAANAGPPLSGSPTGNIYAADYILKPSGGTVSGGGGGGGTKLPTIASVLNGASFAPSIQAGSFVTVFGTNFTTNTAGLSWDGSIVNGQFPTTLGGLSVYINGNPAYVNFVNPTQINVLAPADTATGPVSVMVSNNLGNSQTSTVTLKSESPAFFTFSPDNAKYIAAQIALPNNQVEFLGPTGLFGSSPASRPAKPGEVVLLYGTGFGPTTPPVDPSVVFTGAAPTTSLAKLTIGGQPATVEFSGLSGAGLYQINAVVPSSLTAGDQAVVATVNGVGTTQKVYIAVQP